MLTTVNNNVKVVYDEIGALARDFHNFVQLQVRANAAVQSTAENYSN